MRKSLLERVITLEKKYKCLVCSQPDNSVPNLQQVTAIGNTTTNVMFSNVTETLINNSNNKVLVTKEWVNTQLSSLGLQGLQSVLDTGFSAIGAGGSTHLDLAQGEMKMQYINAAGHIIMRTDGYSAAFGSGHTASNGNGFNFALTDGSIALGMTDNNGANGVSLNGGSSGWSMYKTEGSNNVGFHLHDVKAQNTHIYLNVPTGTANSTDYYVPLSVNGVFADGDGNITVPGSTNPSGLEAIDEGNGTAWRLIGQDAAKFSNAGLGSIDLQDNSTYTGTTFGPGSDYSMAFGGGNRLPSGVGNYGMHLAMGSENFVGGYYNNMALGVFMDIQQGYSAAGIGYGHDIDLTSTVGQGLASGTKNQLRSYWVSALGTGLISKSVGTTVLGISNTDYTLSSITAADRPALIVGIGSASTSTNPAIYGTRTAAADGFIVRFDGSVEAPGITNALIDSVGAKSLVSREWVLANTATLYSGDGSVGTDDRLISVGAGGSLAISTDAGSIFSVSDTDIIGQADGQISLYGNVNGSEVTGILIDDGILIDAVGAGFGGSLTIALPTAPSAGQVLTAADTNGLVYWTDKGGSRSLSNLSSSNPRDLRKPVFDTDNIARNVNGTRTINIESNVDYSGYDIGDEVIIVNDSSGTIGTITLNPEAGVTLLGSTTISPENVGKLMKLDVNTWIHY